MHLLNLEHDYCGDKFWKTQLTTIEIISIVCLEMAFCGDLCHAETGQLICSANRLTGFCVVRVLAAKYFRTNHILQNVSKMENYHSGIHSRHCSLNL